MSRLVHHTVSVLRWRPQFWNKASVPLQIVPSHPHLSPPRGSHYSTVFVWSINNVFFCFFLKLNRFCLSPSVLINSKYKLWFCTAAINILLHSPACCVPLYVYVWYVVNISNHNARICRRCVSLLQEPAVKLTPPAATIIDHTPLKPIV